MISEAEILRALSHVEDPDFKKDLVTLGMIRDLKIGENEVSFSVYLTSPACPMKDMLENACINSIRHFVSKDIDIKIEMKSEQRYSRPKHEVLPGVTHIIAVASGKGGVGKSTVAAGLARALSSSGASVGLMDADIYGPSIPILFDCENEAVEMEEVEGKELMKPVVKEGIKLFSIGFLSKKGEAIVWRGPMVSQAIRQFMNGVSWGSLDYLIVDLPPGAGDVQLTLAQNLPLSGVVIVSTPQKLAVADAARACAMFKIDAVKAPILGIVENMSWYSPQDNAELKYRLFGSGSTEKLASDNDTEILGRIPIKESLSQEKDDQNSIKENLTIFTEIAGSLVRQLAKQNQTLTA